MKREAKIILAVNIVGILIAATMYFVMVDPYLHTKEMSMAPSQQQLLLLQQQQQQQQQQQPQQSSTSTLEDYHSFENTLKRANQSQQLMELNITN